MFQNISCHDFQCENSIYICNTKAGRYLRPTKQHGRYNNSEEICTNPSDKLNISHAYRT